jgi:uncharacterized protein YggE
MRPCLAALVIAAFAASAVPMSAQTPAAPPVVVTQGEATVKRAPDRAWLTVATETRDSRAAEARRKSAEAMTDVQNALRGAGLAADAIRTTAFSLMPELEWANGRSTMRGYLVRNQIEVRVDSLDRLGEVIDAANSARSTTITVTGPRLGLKDEASAESEALRLAVAAAMSRAQAMAAGAKRTLGIVLRIEEHGRDMMPPPQPVMMRNMAAQAGAVETPIAPGEIEVRAQVTVTVELR